MKFWKIDLRKFKPIQIHQKKYFENFHPGGATVVTPQKSQNMKKMTFMGQFASKNEFLQTKPCKMGFYILLTPKLWKLWPKTGGDTLCNYPGAPGWGAI